VGDSEESGEGAGEFLGIRRSERVRRAESHERGLVADFLSPLSGAFSFPRLTPWAAFFRRFAAAAWWNLFLT
jgi:hypothetical protein